MGFSEFKLLGPYLKYMHGVSLSGLAEPLLNKNISDFISYIKKENNSCVVSIFTNATLLTEDISHELVDSKLDRISFSIDSFDPDVNDSIRKNSSLSKILDNLKLLNEIKKQKGSVAPHLFPTTVLQKKNYKHLPGIVKTVAELGIKQLDVNGLEPYTEDYTNNVLWYPPITPGNLVDVFRESLKIAQQEGVLLRLAHLIPVKPYCDDVKIPIILPNGDVIPCSVMGYDRDCLFRIDDNNQIIREKGKNKKKVFGNVFEEGFEEVWFKKEYVSFRNKVLNNKFPEECKNCLIKNKIICVRDDCSPSAIILDLQERF